MNTYRAAACLLWFSVLLPTAHAQTPATAPLVIPDPLLKSMQALQKVVIALHAYANDHDKKWPQKLDELVASNLLKDKNLLIDPADPQKREWIYHPWPAEQFAKLNPQDTPVAWSPTDDPAANRAVTFIDGHVEIAKDQAEIDKLLQAAEAAAKK